MNSLNDESKLVKEILSYGIVEAPAELELLVNKKIEALDVSPRSNYADLLAGWVPVIVSIAGLLFGIFTSIIIIFPNLSSVWKVVNTKLLALIINPTFIMVVLSVVVLVIVDSLLEKGIQKNHMLN